MLTDKEAAGRNAKSVGKVERRVSPRKSCLMVFDTRVLIVKMMIRRFDDDVDVR
jgi:hypothetical protein